MRFINRTNNSIYLPETGKTIPFLGEDDQFIDTDDLLKSPSLQAMLMIKGKCLITEISDARIERNLWEMQNTPIEEEQKPLEVAIRGHFYSNTGYGKSNRNLALGLARAGVRIGIQPVNNKHDGLNEMEINQINLLKAKPNPDAIFIDSTIPTFAKIDPCRYSILYTTVEAATVPSQFIDACEKYDEIWVTSDFCKDVLSRCGVEKRITVVPNGVNNYVYNTLVPPHHFSPKLNTFVFLSVFGWNYRKGYDLLLKAYLDEFSKDDLVTLLIVTKYNFDADGRRTKKVEEEIKEYMSTFGGWHRTPNVARCGREIPEFEMPRLYRACNCFVLPSRGEGFGLPYMEASLCGLPIIGTKCSGQSMFLNDDNAYLVEIDKMSPMENGKTNTHFWDGEMFPEFSSQDSISSLKKKMRYVYDNYSEACQKNRKLQADILSKYTCENVATYAKMKLEEIWNSL